MDINAASIVTILMTVFLFGYVLGVEHGADEERRDQEQRNK